MAAVSPVIPCFSIQPVLPLDKEFLRKIQKIAMQDRNALHVWGEEFALVEKEEALYFSEREWRTLKQPPARHRVDLYTIMRGLTKVFDPKYEVTIPFRQMVLKAIMEQRKIGTSVLQLHPKSVSDIVQLALFDQIVY